MELQTKECYSMDHHLFKLLFKKDLTNDMPSKFGLKGRTLSRFLKPDLWVLFQNAFEFLSDPFGGNFQC